MTITRRQGCPRGGKEAFGVNALTGIFPVKILVLKIINIILTGNKVLKFKCCDM